MPIDASGNPQAPVLIATGRVPVFDAGANATTGAVAACPWAPGGAMQPQAQVGHLTQPLPPCAAAPPASWPCTAATGSPRWRIRRALR